MSPAWPSLSATVPNADKQPPHEYAPHEDTAMHMSDPIGLVDTSHDLVSLHCQKRQCDVLVALMDNIITVYCHASSNEQNGMQMQPCTLNAFRKGSRVSNTGPSRSEAPAILHMAD